MAEKKAYNVKLTDEEIITLLHCVPHALFTPVTTCVWCGKSGSDVRKRNHYGLETAEMCYNCFHRECIIDD